MTRFALTSLFVAAALGACAAGYAQSSGGFLPGRRVLLDAHNCYPYGGLWADRIDRALGTGVPLGIEIDLAWYADPQSGKAWAVVAHSGKVTGQEPLLRDYFFEKVRPAVEKALADGNKRDWPLIVLNVNDLRGGEAAMSESFWATLGEYESWLSTAVKSANPEEVAPIDLKPILVLTNGSETQTRVFYDNVPVGGKLRAFGSAQTNEVSREGLSAEERRAFSATVAPEEVLSNKATNFRRWWNHPWNAVEAEGQRNAGEWTEKDAARLKALVEHAHRLGYWIRFYTLDGFSIIETANGWSPEYNFGSLDAVKIRWKAAFDAGVDFIATDQFESFGGFVRGLGK